MGWGMGFMDANGDDTRDYCPFSQPATTPQTDS
jgi:hypothetical protein